MHRRSPRLLHEDYLSHVPSRPVPIQRFNKLRNMPLCRSDPGSLHLIGLPTFHPSPFNLSPFDYSRVVRTPPTSPRAYRSCFNSPITSPMRISPARRPCHPAFSFDYNRPVFRDRPVLPPCRPRPKDSKRPLNLSIHRNRLVIKFRERPVSKVRTPVNWQLPTPIASPLLLRRPQIRYDNESVRSLDSGVGSSRSPYKDTLKSKECKVNCHKKCESLMPNLCGVNQKLLSEVLETVKREKSSSSKSSDRSSIQPSSSSSPSSSDSEDSLEVETKFQESGKEESPRIRFKKFTIDDFSFLKVLGKGSFGKVMLAELKEQSLYFAVKCLKKDVVLEDDDVECTMIERKVLAMGTNHPFLCKLFCTFQTESHLFFVMEYLSGGDLMYHIQQIGRFDQDRTRFYSAEIVCALKFLHRKGIVYRDLKLDNLVLDREGHVRLVDYGMCQLRVYREECQPSNFCGTPQYIAPEIIRGQQYNQSVDWWSFGVLLYEMLIGQSPFNGTDEDELFWCVCNEEVNYPRFISNEAKHIISLFLIKNPEKRLGMPNCVAGEVCNQPFYQIINWDRLERKEIPPPFRPKVKGPSDSSNFDSHFTLEKPVLSPIDYEILQSMDQRQFLGFTYTNPNMIP